MIRVDIESIVVAAGSAPSVVVLRERQSDGARAECARALSIQTGAYEAAAIGRGMDSNIEQGRPIAHDVLIEAIKELGARIERVEIDRWDAPVFRANVVIGSPCTAHEGTQGAKKGDVGVESKVDARPSDALALATRAGAPIYVEDDVMNRAGSCRRAGAENTQGAQEELERFDAFVQTLSPDDF